jgi:hypothetical protein
MKLDIKKNKNIIWTLIIWGFVSLILIRFVVVFRIIGHAHDISSLYVNHIEQSYPGETFPIDADLVEDAILPDSGIKMVFEINRWIENDFVKNGDKNLYHEVLLVSQSVTMKQEEQNKKAVETFEARRQKWMSPGHPH